MSKTFVWKKGKICVQITFNAEKTSSQTLYEGMLDLSHMKPKGNAWLATVLDGKEINR